MLTPPLIPRQAADLPPSVRYCACGNVIGDGDYASGWRTCAICRRLRRRLRRRR